jgi:hypothetical protein
LIIACFGDSHVSLDCDSYSDDFDWWPGNK